MPVDTEKWMAVICTLRRQQAFYIEIISLGHAKTQNTVLCAHSKKKRIQRGRKRQQAVSHLAQ